MKKRMIEKLAIHYWENDNLQEILLIQLNHLHTKNIPSHLKQSESHMENKKF